MTFWIFAFLFLLVAVLMTVRPLLSPSGRQSPVLELDKAFYRSRITEIDTDLALGRIAALEADAAKAEEGRRLLAVSATQAAKGAPFAPARIRAIAAAVVLLLPAAALLGYLAWGQPQMGDMAIASRSDKDPASQTIDQLLERAEAQLAKNPGDIRGWTVVGPIYLRVGRFDDAILAWRNAARIEPQNPDFKSQLAEALVISGQGIVTQEAATLFEQTLALKPADEKSQFYLAIAATQQGDLPAAESAWRALIASALPNAPWLETARVQLNGVLQRAGKPVEQAAAPAPGPAASDIEAASEMAPEARQEMILAMVARLADRLKTSPADKEGWLRLVNAYKVMGEKDKALAAAAQALAANSGDVAFAEKISQLETAIKADGSSQ